MSKADPAQGTADAMGASKPSEGSELCPKMDIPQYGKKVKNYAEPSAGTTGEHTDKNDALGNPGRFTRNAGTTVADKSEYTDKNRQNKLDVEVSKATNVFHSNREQESKLDKTRMKQLDTNETDQLLGNRYQGN